MILIQADILGQTFYSLIDQQSIGRVDFDMFCDAIQRDKDLLDFFSLVLTGMSDGFIQKNIERMKLETLINRIGSIQQDVLMMKDLINQLTKHAPELVKYNRKLRGIGNNLKKSVIMSELENIGFSMKRAKPISKPLIQKFLDEDVPPPPSDRKANENAAFNSMQDIEIEEIVESPLERLKRTEIPGRERLQSWESPENKGKSGLTLPTMIFHGDSQIIEKDDALDPNIHHTEMSKLADNMMKTPKMQNYVDNQFIRKTTLPSPDQSGQSDMSLILQMLSKIDLVFNRLEAFKSNLADSQEKLKNQIGVKISSHVKKNMGKSLSTNVSSPKNKLLFILHDNWSIMASMMMGIQKSTCALQNEYVGLTARDYKLQYKFELRPSQITSKGNELEVYSKSIFYDYAPYVFKEIRQISNISSKMVVESYKTVSWLARHRKCYE